MATTATIAHLEQVALHLGVEPHEILALGNRRTSHPEWCEHGPDCAEDVPFERVHVSTAKTRHVDAPGRFGDADNGEAIDVTIRWTRYDSHPNDPPPAYSHDLEVVLRSEAHRDEFRLTGGPDHIRRIAAVLVEEADRMERSV